MVCEPKPTRVRVVQHNCAKNKHIMQSILESAARTADIVLMQEPFIHTDGNFQISHPSFECLSLPTTAGQKAPRVMTFISKANPHLHISQRPDICSDNDIQLLEVSTPAIPPFFLFNIYNQSGQERSDPRYTLDRILPQIEIPARSILAGDFNAHQTLWNPTRTTSLRAEPILDLVENQNFEILNNPGRGTFCRKNTKTTSVIDLTLASPPMQPYVVNWAIDDNAATGSDHAVIRFDAVSDEEFCEDVPITTRYNWQKADWEKFQDTLLSQTKDFKVQWEILMEHTITTKTWRQQLSFCEIPSHMRQK
jgi:exonuclease III